MENLSTNNSENGVQNALVNKIQELEKAIIELKTSVNPIGNGSINYAVFTNDIIWGPTTIPAGGSNIFYATLLADPLTFDGLPAISRTTLFDLLLTVFVDAYVVANAYPLGSALSAGQKLVSVSTWADNIYTGISPTAGQRRFYISVTNRDTVAHNYYISAQGIFPRPALKKV